MRYFFIIFLFVSLLSCDNNRPTQVVYPINFADSTGIATAKLEPIEKNLFMDFPFAFDSSSLFIYPVRNTYDSRGSDRKISSDLMNSYQYSDWAEMSQSGASGWFYNFIFQDRNTQDLRPITDKELRFSEMIIIRDSIDQRAANTLLLQVYDQDSNQDKFLSREDLMSYYVASIDGKNLKKISPEGHLINGHIYRRRLKRLYFKTIEDTDKNGKFEKNDQRHQYYYSIKTGKVEEVKLPF